MLPSHLLLNRLQSSKDQALDEAGQKKEKAASHVQNGLTDNDSRLGKGAVR